MSMTPEHMAAALAELDIDSSDEEQNKVVDFKGGDKVVELFRVTLFLLLRNDDRN